MPKSVEELEKEIQLLRSVVGTLIMWVAQSQVAPISRIEALALVDILKDSEVAEEYKN